MPALISFVLPMIEVPAQSNTIEFIMLGILLISIGFIRQSEGARMSLFIRSFVNESLASQQIRQERSFNRMAIPVFIISGFSVSLFVAQIAIQSDRFEGTHFLTAFIAVFASLSVLSAGRFAIYSGISWLFNLDKLMSIFSFNWLLNVFILALALIPISAFIAFGPKGWEYVLVQSGLMLLIGFYILRAVRMFSIVRKSFKVPLVFNLFYLCTLELLPLVIVISAISKQGLG